MRDIFLTLDYELYNGMDSGTVQNCLITPTKELVKVLDKHSFKAVFFVDVCFLLRLKELSSKYKELERDYFDIVSQLKELSNDGHDIQLHVHPNWYRASYSNGKWASVMGDYKLSDLSEDAVEQIFTEGIALLKSITGKDINTFRAGAYCIQTLSNYADLFVRHGIKIDSSVFRGREAKTKKREWYDYTKIPTKYAYHFSSDVTKEDVRGTLLEYTIPSYHISYRDYQKGLAIAKAHKEENKMWGDGKGSVGGNLDPIWKKIIKKIKFKLFLPPMPASIDGSMGVFLDKFDYSKSDYIMIMGHPKCLTPFSLDFLDKFLQKEQFSNKTILQMVNE